MNATLQFMTAPHPSPAQLLEAEKLRTILGIQPTPKTERWTTDSFDKQGIEVFVNRADTIHTWVQGNKWHKLLPFLLAAQKQRAGLESMGGAFSNHLVATAFCAQALGLPCRFYIRGSEQEWQQNAAIQQLRLWGATLVPTTRTEFSARSKLVLTPESTGYQWVPMGGSAPESVPWVAAWARSLANTETFDYIVVPVATAGTVAGFSLGWPKEKKLIAIEVLKGDGYLQAEWQNLTARFPKAEVSTPDWINHYHFGGYARTNPVLSQFCQSVYTAAHIPIEPIYSGKAFWAVSDLAGKGYFEEGSRILIVHTGGIFPWTLGR